VTDLAPVPPPGWYPDPADPRSLRWWDGRWTEFVAPAAVPVPAAAEAPAVASGVVGPPRGRWGWGDVGWTTLLTAALTIGPSIVLVVWLIATSTSTSSSTDVAFDFGSPSGAWLVVVLQVVMWLGMAGWPLYAGAQKGPGWRDSYGFVASWRAVGLGLGGGVALFLGMTALDVAVSSLLGHEITSTAAETAEQMAQVTGAYATLLVMIAVGAPFVEELAFRGLLWGAVVKRGTSPWLATLVAAVPFALIHFEPVRLVSLVFAGLLLGVIRHFGGLGSSMLAHATVNSTSVLLLVLTT